MIVQAEVSLYPLRIKQLSKPIEVFCQLLIESGLRVEPGQMSTHVSGDSEVVFHALQQAFKNVAEKNEVVMTVKISNACPENIKKNYHA